MEFQESLFKRMDAYLFDLMDQFKLTPAYSYYLEFIENIQIDLRPIFNKVVATLVIISPLFVLFILSLSVFSQGRLIERKKTVINKTKGISQAKRKLSQLIKLNGPNIALNSKNELNQKLAPFASSQNLASNNLTITQFNSKKLSVGKVIDARVKFSNFTTQKIGQLLNKFINIERYHVTQIKIEKSQVNESLEGEIGIKILTLN